MKLSLLLFWLLPCLLIATFCQYLSLPSTRTLQTNSHTTEHKEPYPRWSGGIKIDDLVEAIRVSLDRKLYINRVHSVYIVKKDGLYKTSVKPGRSGNRRERRTDPLALEVLQKLDLTAYPFLNLALNQGGFAYLVNHGDSNFCCEPTPFIDGKDRPVLNASVPIFTLSAPVNCTKSFPSPNYRTVHQAGIDWAKQVEEYQVTYPWHKKKRQAVWRGSPTGTNDPTTNQRLLFIELAGQQPDLIDAKFFHTRDRFVDFNETAYLGDWMPMEDFQNYRAIVDLDGNSWSARFAELLCYSSVTLKVQPAYIDYFHMELQPWVHYIPVSADMSDLYERVEFAISDEHQEQVRQIVANANQWCLNRLNMEQLTKDLAHIWDVYAQHLYETDQSWSETWLSEQAKLMSEYKFTRVN